jgi:hypothetical protein
MPLLHLLVGFIDLMLKLFLRHVGVLIEIPQHLVLHIIVAISVPFAILQLLQERSLLQAQLLQLLVGLF